MTTCSESGGIEISSTARARRAALTCSQDRSPPGRPGKGSRGARVLTVPLDTLVIRDILAVGRARRIPQTGDVSFAAGRVALWMHPALRFGGPRVGGLLEFWKGGAQ